METTSIVMQRTQTVSKMNDWVPNRPEPEDLEKRKILKAAAAPATAAAADNSKKPAAAASVAPAKKDDKKDKKKETKDDKKGGGGLKGLFGGRKKDKGMLCFVKWARSVRAKRVFVYICAVFLYDCA